MNSFSFQTLQAAKTQIGSMEVIVNPVDLEAMKFYKKFGFTHLPDSGRMFMTMKKIEEAFEQANG